MNRRNLLKLTALTLGAALDSEATPLSASAHVSMEKAQAEVLPRAVAGVELPDSAIARAATELARSASPDYLFNHAVRTFLFGSLVGRSLRLSFDPEPLYLACILHDLGLTRRFEGSLPFELQGAEAAREFLSKHGYAAEKTAIVWNGIAMHPSMIGQFKRPEIRLVGEGAGADVLGPDASQISQDEVKLVLKAFPRLQFKNRFVRTCSDVVRKYPAGATRSFMRDVGERYVPNFHPRNFCDAVAKAPFSE